VKTKNPTAAAAASVDVEQWRIDRERLMARIGPRLARRKSFGHASDMVTGLMSGLAWKNCWTLAEHLGEQVPYGLQNLLSRGSWDHDGVRDDLRDYVIEQLGHPDGILVVDETGDVKKGTATVGVQRHIPLTLGWTISSGARSDVHNRTDALSL
jgi:SRSO17 transposase